MVGSASIIPNSVIKIKRQSEAVTGWNQKERILSALCVIRIAMTASMYMVANSYLDCSVNRDCFSINQPGLVIEPVVEIPLYSILFVGTDPG